jgi:O-6-methylguanine DNA methyltransferase
MPEISPDFTTRICARIGLDRYVTAQSALGDVYVAWGADGVSAVRPSGDEEAFEAWYRERFGRRCVPAVEDDTIATAARAKLRGEDADVPVDLRECSEFERRVLDKAAEITHGNARPYGWVAREIGSPGATRAVGNALGRNPVPLLIPCHRVVRGDYSAGGYVFGGEAKRALLEHEGLDFSAIGEAVRRGFRYVGCDEGYFCLPTCGDIACRIGEPGYVGLHSLDEAHAHGLQPCTTCRPIAA